MTQHFAGSQTLLFTVSRVHVNYLTVSTGTLPHTCLFPQSSVAFMIVPTTEALTLWPPNDHPQLHKELLKNFTEFSKLKHNCFVLLCSAVYGADEQRVLSLLQQHYFSDRLNFLPVHNSKECFECMISIVKVSCKPLSDIIRERFERVQQQFFSEENVEAVVREIGVEGAKCGLLLDGCGGLSGMAKASQRDLQDYNIDASVAKSVWNLLHGKD